MRMLKQSFFSAEYPQTIKLNSSLPINVCLMNLLNGFHFTNAGFYFIDGKMEIIIPVPQSSPEN